MNAVVGAAVVPSHSSTDFPAGGLPADVASRASSQSSILSFLSTPSLRKSQRRCIRKAVASLGGIPFAYTTTAELAEKSRRESVSRRSASGNGPFFGRRYAQEREESVARGSLSSKGDRFPWNPHKRQNKVVETCAVNHGRISNSAESVHASESFNKNDFVEQNRFHKQSGSSHNIQNYNGSFSKYKRSRAPLLSENQQSRLHNEITVFEGIVEPRKLGSDGCRQADRLGLPDDSDTGFGSVKGQGTKLIAKELEHKQSRPKGRLLLSKLEEELSSLHKKKLDFQGRTGEAQGSEASIREANGTQANGVQTSSKGKGSQTQMSKSYFGSSAEHSAVMKVKNNNRGQYEEEKSSPTLAGNDLATSLGQETLPMNEASKANKSEFTSFNLFSSPPSVLQEVNSSYPLHIPLHKNKGPVCRRAPTSLGSRSIPSSRSVTVRNKHHSNVQSQAMNAYDGASKVMKEKQRNMSLGMFDEMNLEDNKLNAQTFSRKEGGVFRDQGKNFRHVESQAENGTSDTLDSSKQRQPWQSRTGTTEKVVTESELWELKVDSFSDVMPLQSNSVAEPHQGFHIYDEYDSEDEITDALEPISDAETEEDSSLFVKDDLTVLAEHKADLPIQVSLTEIGGDKVSTSVLDAENDMPGLSSSDDVETKNAIDRIQLNCGEGENHYPQSVAAWQKHNTPELPFDFQFSYSETPQRPILGYRETPFSPFGPPNMKRLWMGGKPTKPSKKKQWVLDSFNPPPNNTKGVKPVEAPGPYPEGQGPKAAKTRKEILGEPLTKEEVVYLVEKSKRESRQLNLGRDGLIHNMLDLIHSYWKRRRVCRIKCKGVPTVDMDNVKFHIEDKTGGKIIYQTGGVLYLFRGRNYNYKDRPVIPLMLWKPPPPIYPKLIQPAPEGLTIEEAARLRYLGRKVEPICKLGKNGVYLTLVEDVRGAFKVDDLVRVDCQGLNPSDYKKIGAKLRDLVPCVLLSFDKDNILMWKGNQKTQASMSQALDTETMADNTCSDIGLSNESLDNGHEKDSITPMVEDSSEVGEVSNPCTTESMPSLERERIFYEKDRAPSVGLASEGGELEKDQALSEALQSEDDLVATISSKGQVDEDKNIHIENVVSVDTLWEHAFQSGMAIELQEEDMDSDLVVRKADELAKSAPLAPIYTIKLIYKLQLKRGPDYKPSDEVRVDFGRGPSKTPKKKFKRNPQLPTLSVPGMGGLPVDEIAKLLVKK